MVNIESYIDMVEPYNDLLAFKGIEQFSHLWLVWQFHDNKNQGSADKFRPQVRPPRLGGNEKLEYLLHEVCIDLLQSGFQS